MPHRRKPSPPPPAVPRPRHRQVRRTPQGSLPALFLATAAHDLRNPLSAVFGYAEALLMEPKGNSLTVRQRELIVRMRGAVLRGLELAKNLQAFATGRARPARGYRAAVLPALQGAVEAIWFPPERRLTLVQRLEIPPATAVALAPHELERVIANLLSNAVKFSPDGSTITISTSLPSSTEKGNTEKSNTEKSNTEKSNAEKVVLISVRNSGTFISPRDRARIFEAFAQAPVIRLDAGSPFRAKTRKNSASRQPGQYRDHRPGPGAGTGLGLWIVSEFVTRAGGKVSVSSDRVNGSEFQVLLPIV